jgi:thiol:disulfide interchange protein DsbC
MGDPAAAKKLVVFTDPECPYCSKLHAELKKLVAVNRDVAVYLKLFPLKSHPNAYAKAQVILENGSLSMLEESYAGRKLPAPGPRNTGAVLDETIKLAASLGIDATPTIIFPDGSLAEGYMDAAQIRKRLMGKKKK